ncbi:hypothetical protein [Micromonospora sp. URMC 103]|uniref:hypothetical protein n=1 Tax=Micromonospora sp. URMC 103 TaxID=3423406 RepID=UPI003F1C879B
MEASVAHLHGGPLDGAQRELPDGPGDRVEFTHEARDGTWYVEYRKVHRADDGWHYEATGGMDKQDEE